MLTVCVCVCVCARARARLCVYVCLFVGVRVNKSACTCVRVSKCMCVTELEGERETQTDRQCNTQKERPIELKTFDTGSVNAYDSIKVPPTPPLHPRVPTFFQKHFRNDDYGDERCCMGITGMPTQYASVYLNQ